MHQYLQRIVFILISLSLGISHLWAQQTYNKEDLSIWQQGAVSIYTLRKGDLPLEGKVRILESKRKHLEFTCKAGRIQGEYREYTAGQLSIQGTYREGIREGKWQHFYPSGRVMYERHYRSGKSHGVNINYFANGQVERKRYYNNGKQEGKELIYDQSGRLISEYHYKDDLRHGPFFIWETFGDNEGCKISGQYLKGKKEGRQKTEIYDKQGQLVKTLYDYYEAGRPRDTEGEVEIVEEV